jgi:hypothetical protein
MRTATAVAVVVVRLEVIKSFTLVAGRVLLLWR